MNDAREVLIITGMSGAGRTTVANALEDLGYYVVDNLPPAMLKQLLELIEAAQRSIVKLAIVVDVRGGVLFDDARELIETLKRELPLEVVFLEANDQALVRRFEQVRRPHPLQADGTILDGIRTERARLNDIRSLADYLIDTSELNIHQLAARIAQHYAVGGRPGVSLTVLSFGFKYGIPVDADLIADMRFLPNPFWVPELRSGTGLDPAVRDYVLGQDGAMTFADRYVEALAPVIDGYQREQKHHVVLGVGCTGGKHRSVAMAEYLAAQLGEFDGLSVTVQHRDLGRE